MDRRNFLKAVTAAPLAVWFPDVKATPVLTLRALRASRRRLLAEGLISSTKSIIVLINPRLKSEALALPGFVPVSYYSQTRHKIMERELGVVELFTIVVSPYVSAFTGFQPFGAFADV